MRSPARDLISLGGTAALLFLLGLVFAIAASNSWRIQRNLSEAEIACSALEGELVPYADGDHEAVMCLRENHVLWRRAL